MDKTEKDSKELDKEKELQNEIIRLRGENMYLLQKISLAKKFLLEDKNSVRAYVILNNE